MRKEASETALMRPADTAALLPCPGLPEGAHELRYHERYAYSHNGVRPIGCPILLPLGTTTKRCQPCEQAAHNYKRVLAKWKDGPLRSPLYMMGAMDPIERRKVCITEQVKHVLDALQIAALNDLEDDRRRTVLLLQELEMFAIEVDLHMIAFDGGGISHRGKVFIACPGLVSSDVGLDDVQRFFRFFQLGNVSVDSRHRLRHAKCARYQYIQERIKHTSTAMCESCADLKTSLQGLVLAGAQTNAAGATPQHDAPGNYYNLTATTGLGAKAAARNKRARDATQKTQEPKRAKS
ncbi:hypothetical protein SDRG_05282 [Saprolegnia diclina VS20]|uniref:Uncharacterized protein n=1 Tax=Saprolegnia diclina (strain VS20) TaxID=1156394 RepID=T0QSS7_SAPDV|nr:hypothetical protein SDRG_05282 [Saprolegnia diclina VS20]EQC37055.1 hypothetical protein SDRG_05282 [Saprolegnia diclina VS20]|eukprot:XP_008609217.1 hypothetical protein SDRG_05282 [Saprolegnia diclina VS20]